MTGALVITVGACSSGDGEDDGAEPRRMPAEAHVRMFEGGQTRDVELSGEATDALVNFVCRCVGKTEMVLRVPMNVDVGAIMSTDRGIEIALGAPRELHAGSTGQVVTPTRLLVPLSGRFGGEDSDRLTVFYGTPEYVPGPLAISSGRDSLLQLLSSLGVE